MNRRHFLAIVAPTAGLFLPGCGLLAVSDRMVVKLAGTCSFCHMATGPAAAGVAGRPERICSGCIRLCLDIMENPPRTPPPPPPGPPPADLEAEIERLLARQAAPRVHEELGCSFCDAPQSKVSKLIAGPSVYICDACVADAGTLPYGPTKSLLVAALQASDKVGFRPHWRAAASAARLTAPLVLVWSGVT